MKLTLQWNNYLKLQWNNYLLDNYKPEEDSTSEAVTVATNTMEAATTALEESAPETSTTWDGKNLYNMGWEESVPEKNQQPAKNIIEEPLSKMFLCKFIV